MIFSPFGDGKELDVFPFLRHFGNSTWKKILELAKMQWDMFDDILQNRKVWSDAHDRFRLKFQCQVNLIITGFYEQLRLIT